MCPSISRGGRGYSRIYFYYIKLVLKSQYAGTANLLAPLSLVRGGAYSYGGGNLSDQSINGRYWSRRLDRAAYGYGLFFYFSNVSPQYSYGRGGGFFLRCLSR